MNTQSEIQDKVKANGKWAVNEAKDASKEAMNVGKDLAGQGSGLIDTIQSSVTDLFKTGTESVQTAGKSAVDLAKKYPVQAAVGGIVIGMLLGARLFGRAAKKYKTIQDFDQLKVLTKVLLRTRGITPLPGQNGSELRRASISLSHKIDFNSGHPLAKSSCVTEPFKRGKHHGFDIDRRRQLG